MTKTHFAFYLVFAALRPAATTGNSTEIIQFPRIYVAEINTPAGKEPSAISRFPAEVDLLDYDRITDNIHKISFLVHDKQELSRLVALSKKSKSKTINGTIALDLLATEELRQQITSAVEGDNVGLFSDTGIQSVSAYSTIRNYPCYKNLQGSFTWLDDMVLKALSIDGLNVTKKDIGDSYLKTESAASGYDIWALKVTGTAAAGATKGILFIMSGIHAREMAPPELTSRWVESLVNAYGTDADITAMLDYTEIHLVVQANPDGRQVAETNQGDLRRKNMNPSLSTCSSTTLGVDLNRNFPFKWGDLSGSSNNKCSETYHGTYPASEPEVQAIIEYTKSIFPAAQQKLDPINQGQVAYVESSTVGVFLDVHAYSNLVLSPWSFSTTVVPPNNNGLTAISDKIQYWTNYASSIGYTAAGTTADYAYSHLGTAAYCFELGTKFYQDCATFTNTIYPVNLKPLMHLAKISKAPLSLGQGPDIITLSASYSPADRKLTITSVASDSAWSKANIATAQQSVTEIRAFVNIHPYTPNSVGSLLVNGKVIVDVSSYQDGRYSVYVRAKDSAGYWGPVTATYFVIDKPPTAHPSVKPTTASPTADPSHAISFNPIAANDTANPSRGPSFNPTTASPTAYPSHAPSLKPTTASPTTRKPSVRPTSRKPTLRPTRKPSSVRPTSRKPTLRPTRRPTL